MKIVHLSSVHQTFDTRIFHRQCKSLVKNGYDVDLIIQHKKNELIDGINIIALPVVTNKLERLYKVIPKLVQNLKRYLTPTLFHIHDPELIPIGIWLKRKGHIVIYDVHEDVPQTILKKEWLPKLARKPLAWAFLKLELFMDNQASAIIPVTTRIASRFKNAKLVIVQNFPSVKELVVNVNTEITRKRTFVYVGDIQKERGITELVKVAGLLDGNVSFILAGRLSESYKLELELLNGWNNTTFVGMLDRPSVAKLLSEAGVGLVTFLPHPNHFYAQPNKLFEYMSTGLPIIVSKFPLWEQIINQIGSGLLVDPQNIKQIANAILQILNNSQLALDMGNNGKAAIKETYNWETESDKLLALYKALLK